MQIHQIKQSVLCKCSQLVSGCVRVVARVFTAVRLYKYVYAHIFIYSLCIIISMPVTATNVIQPSLGSAARRDEFTGTK